MKQAHTNIRSEIDVELGRSFSGALNITLMIRMLSEPLCCILLQNDLMVYLPDCFFGLSVSIKKKKTIDGIQLIANVNVFLFDMNYSIMSGFCHHPLIGCQK
jgi:hypothetical protein